MRHQQPLILTCFGPSLFLIASIVSRQLLVGAESACPYLCTCSVTDHWEVIACNGRNLTTLPYLPDPDPDQASPVVDIYINRNRFGYILRNSFYAVAGRLRILEIMDNEDNIEVANAAFEPFRESLEVLRIGPLSGDLNEQLTLFSHLTSLVELTISSCSDDYRGGVLSEPLFNEDSDPHLEVLDVHHCGLWDIKNITFQYLKLKVLNLSNNKFTEVPQAVTGIIATSLTHLYMTNNSISTLKHSYIPHKCKLSVLDFSFNRLTSIDANSLGKCSHLQILNLSYNTGLVNIDSGVFFGLRNLIINLDHTSIVDLNFIQPHQLQALRIEGSKLPCTCHLQLCVMRAFGYKIRGTCVNATTAEGMDLDVSYLDLDCQKDTGKGSVTLEDDIRLTGAEDFYTDAGLCARQQILLETTDFPTATGLPLDIQSTSRAHHPGCNQATSTGVFPDASQSNLNRRELTKTELGNEGDSYIGYFNPMVTASLLFSTAIAKSQEQTILSSHASDTPPTHVTCHQPVFQKEMAQAPVLSSSPLPREDERKQPSSLSSLQVQRLFEESTTPLTSAVEATLLQQKAIPQLKDEPLQSSTVHPESHTPSALLFSYVYKESAFAPFLLSSYSTFMSSAHSLPNTEDNKSPSQSLQPPEVATPADVPTLYEASESQSELFSGEEAVLSSHDGQVTTTSSLTYLESIFASTSSERLHLVEERNPFLFTSVRPLESNPEQSSLLLPLIPKETSKEAGSAALSYQSESTALYQQSGSTALYQQSRLVALSQKEGLSAQYQQEGCATLFSPGDELLAALGIKSLQKSQPMHIPKQLRHQVGLSESMEPSITELFDGTVDQSSKDLPALMPSASTFVSHAHYPQQFDQTHQQIQQSSVTLSPESMSTPHASPSSRSLRYPMYNSINTNTETRRRIWRNVKLSNRRILKSTKEHPEGFKSEVELWILRCPICLLVCFIHGCLTFAAFLRLEHGESKG